jgi:hypothetical protein
MGLGIQLTQSFVPVWGEVHVIELIAVFRNLVESAPWRAANRMRSAIRTKRKALAPPADFDQRARRVFDELKKAPLLEPSHDFAQSVLERLRRLDTERKRPDGPHPGKRS